MGLGRIECRVNTAEDDVGAAVLCGAEPIAASVLAKFATETPAGIEMQIAVSAAMGDCRTVRIRNPFGLDE